MNRLMKIILAVVLFPLIIYLWPSAFGGDTDFLLVSGQSMHPTILDGSFVITKQAAPYEIGEIVAYASKESNINVVHRIIDIDEYGKFIIKGDNNKNNDPGTYSNSDIFGEVLFSTPYVGNLVELARNPLILFLSAIILVAVQMEQKRRKKNKEKIRRILLGIPKPDPHKEDLAKTKPQKPNYLVFVFAMALNVLTYAILQFAISKNHRPEGDQVTGFLFETIDPTFASTLSFGLYSIVIVTLYFITKKHYIKAKYETGINKKSNKSLQLLLGKNTKPIPAVTQFIAALFIIMSIFHLTTIAADLAPLFNM